MTAKFYIIRHGTTAANTGKERLRGWAPWNLSDHGRQEARAAGRFLEGRGVTRLQHSGIRRVEQTCDEVNKFIKLSPDDILESQDLRDWNTGMMEGMYVDAMKPLLDYFQRHPDLVIPGGESYQAFWKRWVHAFRELCDYALKNPTEKLCVITHARNLVTIQHWLKGRKIGPVSYDAVPHPGSVMEITIDGKEFSMKRVFNSEGVGGQS